MKRKSIAEFEALLNDEIQEPKFNPWYIVGTYTMFGFIWILFSDQILIYLVKDTELLLKIQMFKGWFYVFVTASLLYILVKKEHFKFAYLIKKIIGKNQDLTGYSEELIATEEELQEKIIYLKETLDDLQEHKQYIEDIFDNSNTAIILWDFSGLIIDVNQHFLKISGYKKEELIGKKWIEIIAENNDNEKNLAMISELKNKGFVKNFQNRILATNKTMLEMIWNSSLVTNPKTKKLIIVSFGSDITAEKENERLIYNLAYHDQLTGLKNRVMFEKELEECIADKDSFNLYYLDFDDFKLLNDIHGHRIGDAFLKVYAQQLEKNFSDNKVYRWSGDEFIIIEHVNSETQIAKTAMSILEFSNKKWEIEYLEYLPSISIGVTTYPEDGIETYELLKNIDMALHRAKKDGKKRYFKYNKNLQMELERLMKIEEKINQALLRDDFVIYFQPIYNLQNKKIIKIEALLRWNSSELQLTTSELIAVAEKTGQIIEIDRWVLRNVFKFVYENLREIPCGVSINISVQSLNSGVIIKFLQEALCEFPINPAQIALEITEHSLIDNFENSQNLIRNLKTLGFNISLDDFGTRYSSLNYLSKMAFDCLKIDKSYVDNIATFDKDSLIIEQIIKLAAKLGIKTVAEGIETEMQERILQKLGCDYGQGYYFARPMDKTDILSMVTRDIEFL